MAIPTIGGHAHIVVALITELTFVGVTFQAGILKAGRVFFSTEAGVLPIAIADYLVPPVIQHLHVIVPHIIFVFDTLPILFRHFLDDRGVEFRVWRRNRFTLQIPDGESDQDHEGDNAGQYEISVVDFLLYLGFLTHGPKF